MKRRKDKIIQITKILLIIVLPLVIVLMKTGNFVLREIRKTMVTSKTMQKIRLPEPNKLSWLSTQANKIVNAKGEEVILRGVNLASINWGVDEWNAKATTYAITNWKANVIRTRAYLDDYKRDKGEFFFKLEEQILGPARKLGVYVILNNYVPRNLKGDDLPDAEMIKMWEEIARFYKDEPIILYDIIPEPHDTTNEKILSAYQEFIPRLRKIHPKSLIFVTGNNWGREINQYLDKPLAYNNIVYRSNPYNHFREFPGLFGDIALKYPVFLGEFGENQDMNLEDVQALIAYAKELNIGWTAWNFSNIGCPCLLKDSKTYEPSSYGKIVLNGLRN